MYDLTRVGLDTLTAELNYRHAVDLIGTNSASALDRQAPGRGGPGHRVPARRVLRRRIVRHGRISHGAIR